MRRSAGRSGEGRRGSKRKHESVPEGGMNVAMWSEKRREYYLASVRKDGGFVARGRRVSEDGRLLELCAPFAFASKAEAEARCGDLAKTKGKKKGYVPVPLEKLPPEVQAHLQAPPDMQLTPQEMVALLAESRLELYVVFADVAGMEAWFDVGVEYIGCETGDKDFIRVYDRFGQPRECFRLRACSVKPTERAVEVAGKGARG